MLLLLTNRRKYQKTFLINNKNINVKQLMLLFSLMLKLKFTIMLNINQFFLIERSRLFIFILKIQIVKSLKSKNVQLTIRIFCDKTTRKTINI